MLRPLLSERARKDHHATPAPHPLLPRVGPAQQNREGGKKDFEEDSPPNLFHDTALAKWQRQLR